MIYSGGGGGGGGDRFNAQAGITLTDTKGGPSIYMARTAKEREANLKHMYANYTAMPEHIETAILGVMGDIDADYRSNWEDLILNRITPEGSDGAGMDGWSLSAQDLAGHHYGGSGGGGHGFSTQNVKVGIVAQPGKMPQAKGTIGENTILTLESNVLKISGKTGAGVGTIAG